jgi:DUF4097 and DUF4098 domain-containing protein YvlB
MIRRFIPIALVVVALPAAAQTGTGDFHWDKALAAGNTVSIHNINGDVTVTPSTNGHVTITGRKHGRDADHLKVDVYESSRGIDVCIVRTDADDECDEDGLRTHGRRGRDDDWNDGEIDLEIAVPANLLVDAHSVSGDVAVTGAHGIVTANTVSGDVVLRELHASSVEARSVSGDVSVGVAEFTGTGDLDFHSVSGDVTLDVPKDFAADLSLSTVSGEINSDFPITIGNGRMSRRRLEARIGAGGRRLEVATVSGDLKLHMNSR